MEADMAHSHEDMSYKENDKTSTPVATSRTTDNLSSLPADEDDEEFFGVDLLQKMDIEDIIHLREYFFDEERLQDTISKTKGLTLNKREFIDAMEEVAGGVSLAVMAGKLFDSLKDDSSDGVRWENVIDGIIERAESASAKQDCWNPIDSEVKIISASHCKREHIVKIVPLETKSAFCYAVVSRLGRVGIYNGEFVLLDSYKLALKPNEESVRDFETEKDEKQRRSQTTWVADVVYISDSNALLYASSDRSLHIYDTNCLIHIPLCRIIGLQNVPTCLEYFATAITGKPSLLFIGDDEGNITTMKFHQARTALFKKKHPDKIDYFYWSELHEQSDYVTFSTQTGVHNDSVTQITYCPVNENLLSCSNDPVKTLVLRHIDGRRQPYLFKVTRGIKCFHYERSLHIIATGSNDFVVRIWNEVVTKQPIMSLYGHKAPVVDVRIVKYISAIISLSREGTVKVWDLKDYYCQMTLPIQFPILNITGARIDFGTRSIYPGPKTAKQASNFTSNSKDGTRITGTSELALDEIEAEISVLDLVKREENQWNRRRLVMTCSNFVAVLNLTPSSFNALESELPESDGTILPPPPKEHYASAPSPWKVAESYTKTPEGSDESASTGKSSQSSSAVGLTVKAASSTKPPKKYRNFTADLMKSPMENMNTKHTQYTIRQEQMKMLVEQCAPHLALDLHELEPITFSKPLPLTRTMKEKGIDVSDPERVVKAKIQKDPALISVGSSPAAQSPRSSKSSKSTVAKKKSTQPKSRLTPDWFAERIRSVRVDSENDKSLSSQ